MEVSVGNSPLSKGKAGLTEGRPGWYEFLNGWSGGILYISPDESRSSTENMFNR